MNNPQFANLNSPAGAAGPTSYSSEAVFVPAGFFRRFVAAVIDSTVVSLVGFPVSFGLGIMKAMTTEIGSPGFYALTGLEYLISMGLSLAYLCYFYANKGGGVGKLLLGLRVVDAETGVFLSPGKTILREIVGKMVFSFLMIFLFAPLIVAVMRQDKRGLHDLLAGTRVIRKQ